MNNNSSIVWMITERWFNLVKVLVCFDTKYGNTKIVAQKIQEGLEKVEGLKTELYNIKEIDEEFLNDIDGIVIGSPNHMGRPTGTMKNFVKKLSEHKLAKKKVAIFGTYAGRERVEDRAVRKLEKMVEIKLSNFEIIKPTLSIKVKKIRGPIVEGELEKCIDFGERIGLQLV